MRELNKLVKNITDGTRAAHAFIVEGRAGEERNSFVTALAQGLECTDPDENHRPCRICPSCRQVAAGTSLDVVRMNKSTGSGKTARTTYKVDDAAEFIERLAMGAYGRYLIGIIDEADSLSEVIQNKLLKTLEEPGRNTILILAASNRDNLLSTVRSRCSDIRLAEYCGGDSENADIQVTARSITEVSNMLRDRNCRFHEFRTAVDKHIKSREDALMLLDSFEDDMRQSLHESGIHGEHASAQIAARNIEAAAVARMDIRREMTYSKALKRLFLELRQK